MPSFLRRQASTAIAVLLTAGVTAGGPALAHGVRHALFAHDAGKVDGVSAVKFTGKALKRRGKVVATSPRSGRLPNNIIKRAPNSDLLDGLDSLAFLKVGDTAANADLLDGKTSDEFVARAGIFLVQGDVTNYKADVQSGTLTTTPGVGQTTLTSQSSSGNAQVFMVPELPFALYGKQLIIAGIELCYDASANHVIEEVLLSRATNTQGTPTIALESLDNTDRNDEQCRVYTPTTTSLPTETTVGLQIDTTWTAAGAVLRLGRVTLQLGVSNADAVPIAGP